MRDDVPAILPAFDVFALSSLHEGLSIALVEALASGVPCVCTNVGGIPEVVQDGREGLLVRPGDAAALAKGLLRLQADPAFTASLGAAALVSSRRLGIQRAADRISAIYDDVLADEPVSSGRAG